MQPLRLLGLVPALPPPAGDPRLALLIPHLPITPLRLDALRAREPLPLRWGLGLRERLGAWELHRWRWELREWAFGRR